MMWWSYKVISWWRWRVKELNPTPQVSTLRPLQCGCCFGYECNELANQSRGSLLPSIFLGWLGEENSFSFSFFSDTGSTSESRHDRYPPHGCKQIEVILAKHSWSRHCRGRIQILALHPGMWLCLGPSEGSNPIFASGDFCHSDLVMEHERRSNVPQLKTCLFVEILKHGFPWSFPNPKINVLGWYNCVSFSNLLSVSGDICVLW